MTTRKHGTYSAAQYHEKWFGTPASSCDLRKNARAEYMRQYRQTPVGKRAMRREYTIRNSAVTELIRRHRAEFNTILHDQRQSVKP